MLLPNVFRPTTENWQDAWGGMGTPDAVGGQAVELRDGLKIDRIGGCVLEVAPGKGMGPLHWHRFEEELFFVLSGELTVRELRPGHSDYVEYGLGAGELVAYPPNTRIAHCSFNRSQAPVRYLALSDGWHTSEIAHYSDSGKTLLRGAGVLGAFDSDLPVAEHIARARAQAAARSVRTLTRQQRPAWVQGPDRVAERDLENGCFGRALARAAGATAIFLHSDRLTPGAVSGPLHWHSEDEELALVLEGSPTLRQLRDGEEERMVLRPGDVVAWLPRDKVAHQLLNEGDADARVAVVGTCRPDDVVVLPEQRRFVARGLERSGSMDRAGYWD